MKQISIIGLPCPGYARPKYRHPFTSVANIFTKKSVALKTDALYYFHFSNSYLVYMKKKFREPAFLADLAALESFVHKTPRLTPHEI